MRRIQGKGDFAVWANVGANPRAKISAGGEKGLALRGHLLEDLLAERIRPHLGIEPGATQLERQIIISHAVEQIVPITYRIALIDYNPRQSGGDGHGDFNV